MEIIKTYIMKLPGSIVKVHVCKEESAFKYYVESNSKLMEISGEEFIIIKDSQ